MTAFSTWQFKRYSTGLQTTCIGQFRTVRQATVEASVKPRRQHHGAGQHCADWRDDFAHTTDGRQKSISSSMTAGGRAQASRGRPVKCTPADGDANQLTRRLQTPTNMERCSTIEQQKCPIGLPHIHRKETSARMRTTAGGGPQVPRGRPVKCTPAGGDVDLGTQHKFPPINTEGRQHHHQPRAAAQMLAVTSCQDKLPPLMSTCMRIARSNTRNCKHTIL